MNPSRGEAEFKQFLSPRLFGIVASVDGVNELFPMCSGVMLEIERFALFLTVSHYLEDLLKWKESGRLVGAHMIVHPTVNGCGTIPLDFDDLRIYPNGYIDVGFVILPRKHVGEIIRRGGQFVLPQSTDRIPDTFFLIGHASSHTLLRRETIAQKENDKWQLAWPEGFAVSFTRLRFDGKGTDPATLRFVPECSALDDYGGTSGGPVFGFRTGALIRDYEFVGIQSKQVTLGPKVTHLVATSAPFAVDVIREFVMRELLSQS